MTAPWSCVALGRKACLVGMDEMGERAPEARRGIQVHQELEGPWGCLDLLAQLGPKETRALLENLDQRETRGHVDLRDLQVCAGRLDQRVPQECRGM